MTTENLVLFGDFRLDLANEQLWRGKREIPLKPKTFAVLRYLAEHPRRLLSKSELLTALWPDGAVSEAVVKVCINEIRKALGDAPNTPRFIETAHRRGYRFIAGVQDGGVVESRVAPAAPAPRAAENFVGRATELGQLTAWFAKALGGQRQSVFITGEAGIGKTALVDAFEAQSVTKGNLWLGHGQCSVYCAREAYFPLLDALRGMCRAPGGRQLIALLGRHAPTWLAQIRPLPTKTRGKGLERQLQGTTQAQVLQEMAETIEALTAKQPLVLILEDLQWSDTPTVELLDFLARRREPARLFVIGTYRREDIPDEHSIEQVKNKLRGYGQCHELELEPLTARVIEQYLTSRFSEAARLPFEALVEALYRRTEGNALFMVNIVDYLITQDILACVDGKWALQGTIEAVEQGVPEGLRQLIKLRIDRLSLDDRRLLEVGSVVGMEFAAGMAAAGLEKAVEKVEDQCEELVQKAQFLRKIRTTERTDSHMVRCYQFLHGLYREVLYQQIPPERRKKLHKVIGEREVATYGVRVRQIAAELAVHFERAGKYQQAVHYLTQAAQNALERNAPQETLALVDKGLALLKTLPTALDRTRHEVPLQGIRIQALMATTGFASQEVAKVLDRMPALLEELSQHENS